MKKFLLSTALLSLFAQPAFAATGQANTSAIVMFLVFIAGTMVITWWAARTTQTTSFLVCQYSLVAFSIDCYLNEVILIF